MTRPTRPDLGTALAAKLAEQHAKDKARREADPQTAAWAERLAPLDQGVELARTDPAYVAALTPYERRAIANRAANLAARKRANDPQTAA